MAMSASEENKKQARREGQGQRQKQNDRQQQKRNQQQRRVNERNGQYAGGIRAKYRRKQWHEEGKRKQERV